MYDEDNEEITLHTAVPNLDRFIKFDESEGFTNNVEDVQFTSNLFFMTSKLSLNEPDEEATIPATHMSQYLSNYVLCPMTSKDQIIYPIWIFPIWKYFILGKIKNNIALDVECSEWHSIIRVGWWISEVGAYGVKWKLLGKETVVVKGFSQKLVFWTINGF